VHNSKDDSEMSSLLVACLCRKPVPWAIWGGELFIRKGNISFPAYCRIRIVLIMIVVRTILNQYCLICHSAEKNVHFGYTSYCKCGEYVFAMSKIALSDHDL
jgi:hypothetical protein